MAKYNLLQEGFTNDTFAVAFDVYTPRPHFIILPKSDKSVDPEFSRITNEQTQHLIETGKSALACFKIDRAVLSIHRGSWRTTRDKFHVHICVDVDSYLRIYESRKKAIPNWPSRDYVTKQWRWRRDPRFYPENVRGYPYRSYLDDEVAGIRTIRKETSRKRDSKVDKLDEDGPLEGCITKVVYHSSQPKIGFVSAKPESTQDFQNLLSAIEKFAEERNLVNTESKDENHGCHVCLYLGSAKTDDWNYSEEDSEDIRGYIVTTGVRFYQLCPEDLRDDWFYAYKQSDFKCLT
ncbi:uncharacterized protein LOC114538035 [Dendronephthya gigantea]|uniref:uncharacterized protein LOC114538035 n=1 Tax=Dendronephthya gigantea TaxID=151771 RepID=UPI00106923B3|nr:uncharacterized protein LOC114538035 [Dendronephthya gigantea]